MRLFNSLLFLSALACTAQVKDAAPRAIATFTIAAGARQLPAAASWSGYTVVVDDAATAGSCTVGGGSALSYCRSSGSAWVSLGGSGGGGTYTAGLSGCLSVTGSVIDIVDACIATKTLPATILSPWDFSGATSTSPVKVTTSDPVTCAVGMKIFRSDTGKNRTCTSTNVWTDDEGGTTVSAAPPYLVIGGANYLPFGFAATLPPTTGWTDNNFTGATFTTSGFGGAISILSATGGSAQNWNGQTRSISGATTLIAHISCMGSRDTSVHPGCFIGVRNNANDRRQGFRMTHEATTPYMSLTTFGNATFYNGEEPSTNYRIFGNSFASGVFVKLVRNGTSWEFYHSADGNAWKLHTSVADAAYFGAVPDQFIIGAQGGDTQRALLTINSWSAL